MKKPTSFICKQRVKQENVTNEPISYTSVIIFNSPKMPRKGSMINEI